METNKLGNVLLVTGHTYEQHSVANKLIIKGIKERIPSIKEDNLAQLYPDYRINVKAEQEKLLWADTIIIQVPLFWFAIPSIVMRWIEEVLVRGWAYGSNGKALQGKNILVGITAGSPTNAYEEGTKGVGINDINKHLNTMFSFCGMNYKGLIFSGGFRNTGDGTAETTFPPMAEKHVSDIMNKLA